MQSSPSIGSTGKGASAAGIFTGDNSAVFGNKSSGVPIWMVVVGALAGVGLLVWFISRK